MSEDLKQTDSLLEQYRRFIKNEPKLISNYVPVDAAEQKQMFLSGEIIQPDHQYDKLDALDFETIYRDLDTDGRLLLENSDLSAKFRLVYEAFINNYQQNTRLMELAQLYNHSQSAAEKQALASEYMKLNIELYGQPDEQTYRSMLVEKLDGIAGKQLDGKAAELRNELFELTKYQPGQESPNRFAPSGETIQWSNSVVETLYDDLLRHIPEQKKFTAIETRAIFEQIINAEFGESAAGWRVDIEQATSINVKSTEKRVVIPVDRKDISHEGLRKLVVHEIGVHVLRSITGAQSDLDPMQQGLNGYNNAEEGLGVAMEQALVGTYVERGVDHYISAGLAYYDQMNFRDTFEVKWRLGMLSKLEDSGQVTDAAVEQARDTAYKGATRIFRGTDDLPWFKDLAYYNGTMEVWKFLEKNRGDVDMLTLLMQGKMNTSDEHRRILLETADRQV